MSRQFLHVRIGEDLAAAMDEAIVLLSAERAVPLSRSDVHRIALRELLARLGVECAPQGPSQSPNCGKRRKKSDG